MNSQSYAPFSVSVIKPALEKALAYYKAREEKINREHLETIYGPVFDKIANSCKLMRWWRMLDDDTPSIQRVVVLAIKRGETKAEFIADQVNITHGYYDSRRCDMENTLNMVNLCQGDTVYLPADIVATITRYHGFGDSPQEKP